MRSRPAHAAAISVAVVVATCVAVVVALPALTGSAAAKPGGSTPAWLQRVNDVRTAAGVSPVSENPSWTLGIQHHLTYLEQTPASYRTGQYTSDHTENPSSPYYTSDGALEGSRSNLVRHASQTDTSAVDYWFGAPFHAIGMLRAGLQSTAFAQDSIYAGMDVVSGYNAGVRSSTPVLFPGPGSTSYLTSYAGHESPDPIETCRKAAPGADYAAPGLPLIAMLPSAPASSLTATLTTPSGTVLSSKSADLCVVDENTYFSSDSVYGSTGLQILQSDHAVLLVPRTPLVAGAYTARISQSRQADIAWSFLVDPSAAPTPSPTTTAPTTTAPTTPAPTSATTGPPLPEQPEVSVSAVACSYGARATGSVSLAVTNPADGAGAATYSVAVGSRSVATDAVADGGDGQVTVTGLPGGSQGGSVQGSDGTSAAFPLEVTTCPAYEGVRVAIRKVADHRLRVRLDNSRNSAATRFRLVIGERTIRHRVPATEVQKVKARLWHAAVVRVYVGDHLVGRARLRP
ncbi:MAG TPA: CAP domain-containing protein [Nocardioides sp.]|nr:CAP domain-containing protein [Nocardioides sp.]